jgi:hypothetical protein
VLEQGPGQVGCGIPGEDSRRREIMGDVLWADGAGLSGCPAYEFWCIPNGSENPRRKCLVYTVETKFEGETFRIDKAPTLPYARRIALSHLRTSFDCGYVQIQHVRTVYMEEWICVKEGDSKRIITAIRREEDD